MHGRYATRSAIKDNYGRVPHNTTPLPAQSAYASPMIFSWEIEQFGTHGKISLRSWCLRRRLLLKWVKIAKNSQQQHEKRLHVFQEPPREEGEEGSSKNYFYLYSLYRKQDFVFVKILVLCYVDHTIMTIRDRDDQNRMTKRVSKLILNGVTKMSQKHRAR